MPKLDVCFRGVVMGGNKQHTDAFSWNRHGLIKYTRGARTFVCQSVREESDCGMARTLGKLEAF
jgi:hypothetical protein